MSSYIVVLTKAQRDAVLVALGNVLEAAPEDFGKGVYGKADEARARVRNASKAEPVLRAVRMLARLVGAGEKEPRQETACETVERFLDKVGAA